MNTGHQGRLVYSQIRQTRQWAPRRSCPIRRRASDVERSRRGREKRGSHVGLRLRCGPSVIYATGPAVRRRDRGTFFHPPAEGMTVVSKLASPSKRPPDPYLRGRVILNAGPRHSWETREWDDPIAIWTTIWIGKNALRVSNRAAWRSTFSVSRKEFLERPSNSGRIGYPRWQCGIRVDSVSGCGRPEIARAATAA